VYFVSGARDRVAVLRLAPPLRQPPPSGLFVVVEVVVLPTNAVPPVNLPVIVVDATVAYVRARFDPVDVVPLFHFTDTVAVPGFEYVTTCAQLSLSVAPADKVNSPLVIPGVPVQPEIVPFAVRVWATLTVGETGGDNVRVPASAVHANAVPVPAGAVVTDDADVVDVVDVDGAELLEELPEHAGRTAVTTTNAPTVTTRRVCTRVTPVLANISAAPYVAIGTCARADRSRVETTYGVRRGVMGREGSDAGPRPCAFIAVMVNVYDVLLSRPCRVTCVVSEVSSSGACGVGPVYGVRM
jgi:hypothetical protein